MHDVITLGWWHRYNGLNCYEYIPPLPPVIVHCRQMTNSPVHAATRLIAMNSRWQDDGSSAHELLHPHPTHYVPARARRHASPSFINTLPTSPISIPSATFLSS